MPKAVSVEVERKFDVADLDEVPDLRSIPGVGGIRSTGDLALDAVYYDTRALDLAAQGITLRRRTGGNDAGWHLKLPVSSDKRYEVREPLEDGSDAVPPRLRSLVLAHTRSRELIPVAHLKTRRSPVRILSTDGTVLAEFSDDRVQSTALLEPVENSTWREWELELVDGPSELLAAVAAAFEASGHRPAKYPSKLARALSTRYPADRRSVPRPRAKGPASAVLVSYVNDQVRALKSNDPGVRRRDPDSVHQLRLAARKIRSALSTFRGLTDKGQAQSLRGELRWLAGAVGTARDLDVMRIRLAHAIDAEPPVLDNGGARQHLEEHLTASFEEAIAQGIAALNSDRYFQLLESLDGFLVNPPLSASAQRKSAVKIQALVNAERRRLKKAVRSVVVAEEGARDGGALHEVRKSAKRLRYAADAARPIFGKQAAKASRRAQKIQAILGEHQDSIVIRERLSALIRVSPEPGARVGFIYGRLHALEQQRADEARTTFVRIWRSSPPKRLRRV